MQMFGVYKLHGRKLITKSSDYHAAKSAANNLEEGNKNGDLYIVKLLNDTKATA